jgi:CheY-like chemotaxis protein
MRRGTGKVVAIVPSNVIPLPAGPHSRVLIAHRRHDVRNVLRTLIEGESVAVVDVSDAEAALAELERARFDLLVLELDLPLKDGVSVMQIHRMLLAHERIPVEAPAVILTLAPEVRGVMTLTDHLRSLGVAGFIDDAPRADAAALVEEILRARVAERVSGKPAAA